MKTSLKTVAATVLTALALSVSAFTSVAAEQVKVMESNGVNPEIKKVIITGNVKVLLIQSYNEQVVMDEDNLGKVTLKQVGHTLTIGSNEKRPVTVTVYVNDPYRIDASGASTVRTVGKFNVKHLQVMLKDNAVACIKAKTESLYTVINGNANLELQGSTANHIIKSDGLAKLITEDFAALKTDRVSAEGEMAMNNVPKKIKK